MSPSIPLPEGIPAHIAAALEQLLLHLQQQAPQNFAGLILYGGVARGRYKSGRSDVNVMVLLNPPDGTVLKAISPALTEARRAAAVQAMLLSPQEVESAAHDFPSKYLDIQRHHVVLYGEDPFTELKISPEEIKRRVAQSLRNQLMRLRNRFVVQHDEPLGLASALADAARPLAIDLSCLLIAQHLPVPEDDRTASIYQAASLAFDLDTATLSDLAAVRNGSEAANPERLFSRLLALLSSLSDRADAMARAS